MTINSNLKGNWVDRKSKFKKFPALTGKLLFFEKTKTYSCSVVTFVGLLSVTFFQTTQPTKFSWPNISSHKETYLGSVVSFHESTLKNKIIQLLFSETKISLDHLFVG